MAIAAITHNNHSTMSSHQESKGNNNIINSSSSNNNNTSSDDHDHDMVMPGFRFHPTEEELVEFYLRRKVEGKRFNVELITFLDLYRYDPWELPALAAIGEKEWFFYVPRDRKYRNGDRPNRVTTSGYWKATGADRMIRGENSRSIGLKKTLVFYSGKAPKGIRTSWIMNEYRLPQHETERYQKTEISLCRVYKRSGVEDHPSLPRTLPTRPSARSSGSMKPNLERFQLHQNDNIEIMNNIETDGSCSSSDVPTTLGLSKHHGSSSNTTTPNNSAGAVYCPVPPIGTTLGFPAPTMEDDGMGISFSYDTSKHHHHHHQQPPPPAIVAAPSPSSPNLMFPNSNLYMTSACPSSAASSSTSNHLSSFNLSPSSSSIAIDDLHRLVNYRQQLIGSSNPSPQQPLLSGHHDQLFYPYFQFPATALPQLQQLAGLNTSTTSSINNNNRLASMVLHSTAPGSMSDRLMWEWNNQTAEGSNRDQQQQQDSQFK